MVSWRSWLAVVLVAVAAAAACSGKTDVPSRGHAGSAGRGESGGSAGRVGGTAGAVANVGGTAGGLAEGGEGGVPAAGGSAGGVVSGAAGVGGTFTFGGGAGVSGSFGGSFGGSSGSSGVGGSSGADNFPPFSWKCGMATWGDGTCHCGCGAPDPDCKDADIDTCDVCDLPASCSGRKCPGRIDPANPTLCQAVPFGWTCPARSYDDGKSCDCGCGAPDPDCDDDTVAACDACDQFGSCSKIGCPGPIDPLQNYQCDTPPGWSCAFYEYGDGICDCGCGALDIDCPSASVDDCEFCAHGCSFESCPGQVDPDNNAYCTGPPADWSCQARFYNDGAICHCGCGAIDPDCDPVALDSCDRCNVIGACSGQDCPGTIDPDNIGSCLHPDPPSGWECDFFSYADGFTCDCGCGVLDPDCRGSTPAACNVCWGCGECPGRVDPADLSSCLPPPSSWTCDPELYSDGFNCDCGCGVLDLDCPENFFEYCSTCPEGGCSRSDCRDIDRDDIAVCDGGVPPGWECPVDYYGDTACDCGCGGRDEDCSSASASVCEFCDSPGSCASSDCLEIDPTDNAVCE